VRIRPAPKERFKRALPALLLLPDAALAAGYFIERHLSFLTVCE
jgi:hypothetical protein